MDSEIKALLNEILEFRHERDWEQFHTPKNLAISIDIEAAELLELFQWLKESEDLSAEKTILAAEEIADVLIYLLLLAHELDINLLEATRLKMAKNREKYPIEWSRGSSRKYDEF